MNAFRRDRHRAALVHRKLHGAPAGLDARFSPTAIFPTTTEDDDPFSIIFGTKTEDVTTKTTSVLTPVIPTTSARSTSTTVVVVHSTTSSLQVTTSQLISTSLPTLATSSVISRTISTPSSTSVSTTPVVASTKAITSSSQSTVAHVTLTNTLTSAADAVATSSSAAASSSTTPTHATSTGAIVGGVAAGLLGVVAVCVVIAFFFRRWRTRKDNDITSFRPDSFRRSAVLLDGPPTHEDTIQRGYNPRPPSMVQRRLDTPLSFGTQYGAPGPAYPQNQYGAPGPTYLQNGYGAMDQYQQTFQQPYSPYTPNSAAPMMYSQSPFSPIAPSVESPTVSPYDSAQDPQERKSVSAAFLNRSPSDRTLTPTVTRPFFNGSSQNQNLEQHATYPELPTDPARLSVPLPSNEYVDVTRSSVTPFQAAQYVEISKKLNTQVPNGLPTPEVEHYVQSHQLTAPQEAEEVEDNDAPPAVPAKDAVSPFADPVVATDAPGSNRVNQEGEQDTDDIDAQELEFPTPPSPAVTTASRYRIDSMPPSLPEIRVQSRSSFSAYDFPSSVRGSPMPGDTPLSSEFSSEIGTPIGRGLMAPGSFPTTPSPLASSFIIQSPPAAQTDFSASSSSQTHGLDSMVPVSQARPEGEKKRPDTIYDPEDAYGGI